MRRGTCHYEKYDCVVMFFFHIYYLSPKSGRKCYSQLWMLDSQRLPLVKKCFFSSTFHVDVMLKESVCSHFLPTLCTLLPLSQVGVGVEARALVLRPPRVVSLVPPVQRKATTFKLERKNFVCCSNCSLPPPSPICHYFNF